MEIREVKLTKKEKDYLEGVKKVKHVKITGYKYAF